MFVNGKQMTWLLVGECVLLAGLFLMAESPTLSGAVGLTLVLTLAGFWFLLMHGVQKSEHARPLRLSAPAVLRDFFGANQHGVSPLLATMQIAAIGLAWTGIVAMGTVPFMPELKVAVRTGTLLLIVVAVTWVVWVLAGRRRQPTG